MLSPQLLAASTAYREALIQMSRATSGFADALETCARSASFLLHHFLSAGEPDVSLKGASYLSGSRLLAASGLHHLMGNHWHVLVGLIPTGLFSYSSLQWTQSDSIDKKFERPLRQHLDSYRSTVSVRHPNFVVPVAAVDTSIVLPGTFTDV